MCISPGIDCSSPFPFSEESSELWLCGSSPVLTFSTRDLLTRKPSFPGPSWPENSSHGNVRSIPTECRVYASPGYKSIATTRPLGGAAPARRARCGDLAPPLRDRWFADSPLEEVGLELLVPLARVSLGFPGEKWPQADRLCVGLIVSANTAAISRVTLAAIASANPGKSMTFSD